MDTHAGDAPEEITQSLLRQGFRRQIYVSFHGPAHITISPVVRDFMDEFGIPILYLDLTMQMFRSGGLTVEDFHAMTVGAYEIMAVLRMCRSRLNTSTTGPAVSQASPSCTVSPMKAAPQDTTSEKRVIT